MANRLHRSADDQEPEEPDAKVKSEPIANEQSSIQHEAKSEQKVEPIEEEEEDFFRLPSKRKRLPSMSFG